MQRTQMVQGTQQLVSRRLLLGLWGLAPAPVLSNPPFEDTCQTSQQISIAEGFGQARVKCYVTLFYHIKDTTEWL